MRKQKYEQKLKEKKKGTLNQIHAHYKAGLTLGQKLIHTQKLIYVWKLQNYEQSCCLSKHRHTALRGRICWQRRYYSVKL